MRIELRPSNLLPTHRKEKRQRREARGVSDAEIKRRTDGIIDYHRQLLHLNPTQLARYFDQTMCDPTVIKQQSVFGKDDSSDKTFIYHKFEQAFDAHQRKTHTWRKYSDQPYIVHPMRAALLSIKIAQAMGVPVTPELIGTALAHDVTEDSPKFNGGERLYKQGNLETLSSSIFRRKREKAVAADAYALSHHDVLDEDGEVDEQKYFEKITNGDDEAVLRRKIVKAADRLDNLLDPDIMNKALEKTRKKSSAARDSFLASIDRIATPTSLTDDLHNPSPGSEAEKLRQKRINYIDETTAQQGLFSHLFENEKFLDQLIVEAVFASVNTIANEDYNEDNLPNHIKNKRLTSVVDEPEGTDTMMAYYQSAFSQQSRLLTPQPYTLPIVNERPLEMIRYRYPRRGIKRQNQHVSVYQTVYQPDLLSVGHYTRPAEVDYPGIDEGIIVFDLKPRKFRTYGQAERTVSSYLEKVAA